MHWVSCVFAALLLVFTTAASIGVLVSNAWFTSSTGADIGLACAPGSVSCATNMVTNAFTMTFNWSSLTTTDQKAAAGLLIASIICGVLALFFLVWAICCFCCLLRVGGIFAGIFAFLQFISLLSAVMVFASMWGWKTPTGYSMGPAYITAIVAIPAAFLASAPGRLSPHLQKEPAGRLRLQGINL